MRMIEMEELNTVGIMMAELLQQFTNSCSGSRGEVEVHRKLLLTWRVFAERFHGFFENIASRIRERYVLRAH